jgi:hypothetical protein
MIIYPAGRIVCKNGQSNQKETEDNKGNEKRRGFNSDVIHVFLHFFEVAAEDNINK